MRRVHSSARSRRGFTLVEVALAVTVMLVAMMAMSASSLQMNSLRRQNRERSIAQNMIRVISENIHAISDQKKIEAQGTAQSWADLMVEALSPGGELGTTFGVLGLNEQDGQATVGTIRVILDESTTDAALGLEMGLPRDLNGDGDATDIDVSANARILPVLVTARWNGVSGDVTIRHPFYIIGY